MLSYILSRLYPPVFTKTTALPTGNNKASNFCHTISAGDRSVRKFFFWWKKLKFWWCGEIFFVAEIIGVVAVRWDVEFILKDRKVAQVHECRDSSLALRRLCDKLKVRCPKCGYETERTLLSDHLPKCGRDKIKAQRKKQPLNDKSNTRGRSRSRENLDAPRISPVKWHRRS